MTKFIRAFLLIIIDSDLNPIAIPASILFIIGLCGIFKKCGSSAPKALIPGYRYYMISRFADVEIKGRAWLVLIILNLFINLFTIFGDPSANITLFIDLAFGLPISIITFIISIQIYLSLINIFNVGKPWIILWVIFPALPALIWGYSKKYQPTLKLSDIDSQKEIIISGSQATVMKEGLTVNLEERAVFDFFKKKYLLRDIHLNIKPGSMVLLLGGSGAGKTTLLNAVTGYEQAKAEIVLDSVNIYSDYKKIRHKISFVPQQDLMRYKDTVYDTLLDASALRLPYDFSSEDRKKRVHEVMDIFGLTPVQKSLVEKLSGGQKKRLSIAMEFIPNPSLFILDEPDSGLDGVMARDLMLQLRKIADTGKIVIVITHTPDRVVDLFDDVIVLAKDSNNTGRLAYFGSTDNAHSFFETDSMEKIVKLINPKSEGGEERADEFINRFAEVQNG